MVHSQTLTIGWRKLTSFTDRYGILSNPSFGISDIEIKCLHLEQALRPPRTTSDDLLQKSRLQISRGGSSESEVRHGLLKRIGADSEDQNTLRWTSIQD